MTKIVHYKGETYRVDYSTQRAVKTGPSYLHFGFFKLRLSVFCVILSFVLSVSAFAAAQTGEDQSPNGFDGASDSAGAAAAPAEGDFLRTFHATGMVFPDSSNRLLTWDDIAKLDACAAYSDRELLCYAINEIYARHGYRFRERKYADFYGSYGYCGTKDMEAAAAEFDPVCECKNVEFLCMVARQRGYR